MQLEGRACGWCRELLRATARSYQDFCSQKCRQAAFRLRRRRATDAANELPMRFAYADPPYPGRARKYYGDQPTFAGEVNHKKLIESLEASAYDGWALSTAADALRDVLPLCPKGARVCSWVKPIGVSPRTFGIHNVWEPLIVVRGRALRGGVRDWLRAQPARFGGTLPGRKPLSFCAWLFDLLGMLPGDTLADIFPGTGVVSRAWASLSLMEERDASPRPRGNASPTARANASPEPSAAPCHDAPSSRTSGASSGDDGDASFAPAQTTRRSSTTATASGVP